MRPVGSTFQYQRLNEENTPPTREEEKNPPPSSLQTSVPTKKEKAKIRIELVEVHRAITVGAKYEEKRPQKTISDRPKYLGRPNTPRNVDVTSLAVSLTDIGEKDPTTTADLTTGGAPLPTTGFDAGAQQSTVSRKAPPGAMRLPNILPAPREKSTSTGSWAGKKVKKPRAIGQT
jgi:hypothetical protein